MCGIPLVWAFSFVSEHFLEETCGCVVCVVCGSSDDLCFDLLRIVFVSDRFCFVSFSYSTAYTSVYRPPPPIIVAVVSYMLLCVCSLSLLFSCLPGEHFFLFLVVHHTCTPPSACLLSILCPRVVVGVVVREVYIYCISFAFCAYFLLVCLGLSTILLADCSHHVSFFAQFHRIVLARKQVCYSC